MKMINVKDLTFSYKKGKQALHGLNFTVNDGEIFGFLGPNGSEIGRASCRERV